ncbi:MAG: triose-phosphate isomerase [Candidatus Lloydbacteria bacterium CG22_combo_CG10-13_8_21_14_all_47_15]|uniref:Triosephosphate isomerase n=1 Tax=Candidatus Lloydbacteria bacterium CG22_combo_CG10-13_8_21_14_all_47_15 TaxID=1974635 RepID=A0A2H0CVC8_9BACT|nr:MAG: triose-phosphate isomerase [Candidatus Lloydbacteria bacterium CG22_combo_CG10-13_8_21_14_all_47_15]
MAEKKIVVANWKMNPVRGTEARKIFSLTKQHAGKTRGVQTVVCPPFVFLSELAGKVSGHRCVVGAQDAFWESEGAYTGLVSAAQVADTGAAYVILGHSERRAAGETSKDVARKVKAALDRGLVPIVCVGESERDDAGRYLSFVETELKESLAGIARSALKNLVIAYEPIWAIGEYAVRSATPHEFENMLLFIRKILVDAFGKKLAFSVPILYGGSVDDGNAADFLGVPGSGGLLVGRASLSPKIFSAILDTASKIDG